LLLQHSAGHFNVVPNATIPVYPPFTVWKRCALKVNWALWFREKQFWNPRTLEPTSWWAVECRGPLKVHWNGRNALISKYGIPIPAPKWFLKALPKLPMDGELWSHDWSRDEKLFSNQRGCPFSDKSGFLGNTIKWRTVRFRIFDTSLCNGFFEERMNLLQTLSGNRQASISKRFSLLLSMQSSVIAKEDIFFEFAEHWKCLNCEDLLNTAKIAKKSNITIAIRKPKSFYYEPLAFLEVSPISSR